MLQPRARAPVEGEAIKWGHWSECSEHCVKVRHRLNCDDILPQLPAKTNLTASQARASGPPFGQQKGASRRSLSKGESLAQKSNQVISYNSGDDEDNKPAEEQDEESILAKADQVDDENYQEDEAGQEAEADMCVLVDPSNTMEEKPCTGGLCRRELPVPLQAPGAVSASSAGQLGAPSSGNKVRARERVSSKQRTVNGYRQEKPARGQSFGQPEEEDRPESEAARAGLLAGSSLTRQHDKQTAKPARLQPVNLAGPNINQTSGPIWSSRGAMWLSGPPAQTARIIEWTIIVGSLLSILLLIMLILRKLFASSRLAKAHSSYQWMLAKQTLKEQQEPSAAAFCQTASGLPPHLVQFKRQQQGLDDRPAGETTLWPGSTERQLSVDATGRHLFGATFNTDLNAHRRQPSHTEPARRLFSGGPETDGNSVISIYDYDTLGAAGSSRSQELAKGAFLPTRDFVAATPARGHPEWAGEKHKSAGAPKSPKSSWNNAESRSSSLASSGRSSATAQMLSNGASSGGSFEQQQQAAASEQLQAPPSLDCSPASVGGARGKLIGLSLQPVHSSQPSTPLVPAPARCRPANLEVRAFKSSGQLEMVSQRRVLRLASEFEGAGNGCNRKVREEEIGQVREHQLEGEQEERHFYEEISSQPKQVEYG